MEGSMPTLDDISYLDRRTRSLSDDDLVRAMVSLLNGMPNFVNCAYGLFHP